MQLSTVSEYTRSQPFRRTSFHPSNSFEICCYLRFIFCWSAVSWALQAQQYTLHRIIQGHLVKESIYRSLESVSRSRRCTAECLPAMYQSQIVASSESASIRSILRCAMTDLLQLSAYLVVIRLLEPFLFLFFDIHVADSLYSIGGQNFSLILDTGSSDLVSKFALSTPLLHCI
jgi:hypothetical protein